MFLESCIVLANPLPNEDPTSRSFNFSDLPMRAQLNKHAPVPLILPRQVSLTACMPPAGQSLADYKPFPDDMVRGVTD